MTKATGKKAMKLGTILKSIAAPIIFAAFFVAITLITNALNRSAEAESAFPEAAGVFVAQIDKATYDGFADKYASNNGSVEIGFVSIVSDSEDGWFIEVAEGYAGTVHVAYNSRNEYYSVYVTLDGVNDPVRIGDGRGRDGINHVKIVSADLVPLASLPPMMEDADVPGPEADGQDANAPATAEPDATEPDATEPDATEPNTTELNVTEPDATEPDTTMPDATEPDTTEPDVTEPDSSEPNEASPAIAEPDTAEAPQIVKDPAQPVYADDFYMAYFNYENRDISVKVAVYGVVMRFLGTHDSVDVNDFTDMVLTRDGVPVGNAIAYNGVFGNGVWWSREDTWGAEVTDFYFDFEAANTAPGRYGFSGKYKGVPFEVYDKVIEQYPIGDAPADPGDFRFAGFCGMGADGGGLRDISEFTVHFNGAQQTFSVADLSDLKLTLNGNEIGFSFQEYVFRYLETEYNGVETGFNLLFDEPLTASGTYRLTGFYRGIWLDATGYIA